jgi:RNA polymerase sigma-70 factor, ECF subfamily
LDPNELERFEALVLPHLDAAYTLARYLTRDAHAAEDVVQDAALRAVKYFSGFRGTSGADGRAWLLAIVRNTAYSALRSPTTQGVAAEVFDEEQHSAGGADEDPSVDFDRQETRDRLRDALAQLPAEFREVIVLREIQDLSYQEISDITAVPVGTVMSRLSRARQRLKRELVRADKEPVR